MIPVWGLDPIGSIGGPKSRPGTEILIWVCMELNQNMTGFQRNEELEKVTTEVIIFPNLARTFGIIFLNGSNQICRRKRLKIDLFQFFTIIAVPLCQTHMVTQLALPWNKMERKSAATAAWLDWIWQIAIAFELNSKDPLVTKYHHKMMILGLLWSYEFLPSNEQV